MSPTNPLSTAKVLVTGAGGPAAIAVIRSLEQDPSVTLVAADMDPWASGLYMVAAENRCVVPAGLAPDFVDELLAICVHKDVNILIPTVDAELLPIARAAHRFAAQGIQILGASEETLERTLDKFALAIALEHVVRVPRTEFLGLTNATTWDYPVIVKPRQGSGSRGVAQINSDEELLALRLDRDMLIQEFLPGDEYSVDVLATREARVVASVPRIRQRVDSGVSVAGYTVRNPALEDFARTVVETLGLPFVSNVQIRIDAAGEPALLEVNPRVPGSLALTVAAGVDMARLAVDNLRGFASPSYVAHREVALVRFLDETVVEISDLVEGAMPLSVGAA